MRGLAIRQGSFVATALLREIHWDRKESVDEAMRALDRVRLLDTPMLRSLFPDARILTERVALLPKSLIAVREPGA